MSGSHYIHKEFPKTKAETDFWGQVKRSVNGQPVSEAQIEMIVTAIRDGLALRSDDRLLDLGCGNGALSDRLFAQCRGGLGVDFSDYLIGIAQKYFEQPERGYQLGDIADFAAGHADTADFSVALCYGVFAYLPAQRAAALLADLHRRFAGLRRVFIGNLPDRARLGEFYRERDYQPGIEDEADSPIGIWRSAEQFGELATAAGWQCQIARMPAGFYAAHYRFDAILSR
jgi:SAM-dependent methyltransferase